MSGLWGALLARLGVAPPRPAVPDSAEAERIIATMQERSRALRESFPDYAETHARALVAERRLRALRERKRDAGQGGV